MIHRSAVRALLLAEEDARILLMKIHLPDRDECLWITPGGGMEPGEDPGEALVREVREETGYVPTSWTGPVWIRRHVFRLEDETFDQRESFFLVRTDRFDPDHRANPAEFEQRTFREFRWWALEEIAGSDEISVPRMLARHLALLIETGCRPGRPVDVGV